MKRWIAWDDYNKAFQLRVGTLTDPKHNTWYLMRVDEKHIPELLKARFRFVQRKEKGKELCSTDKGTPKERASVGDQG